LESRWNGTKWPIGYEKPIAILVEYSARFSNLEMTSVSQKHPVSEGVFDQDKFLASEE
jgi:hypothetical protein